MTPFHLTNLTTLIKDSLCNVQIIERQYGYLLNVHVLDNIIQIEVEPHELSTSNIPDLIKKIAEVIERQRILKSIPPDYL